MNYEIQRCAICGFRAKTPRGFATHIRRHKLDKATYVNLYGEYATVLIDPTKLRCPICGLPNFENVKIHMKHIHKLTDEEISKYEDSQLVLPSYRENAANGGKATQQHFLESHPNHIPYKPKYGTRSEASKAAWQNPEYRRIQAEKCRKQHQSGSLDPIKKRKTKFTYKEMYMRSSWEVAVASYLDTVNIEWQYEKVCVFYVNPKSGKKCRYFPDFFLPRYNIVIEVKPFELCQDEVVKAKRKASVDAGYNFQFLTENELENLSEFFARITDILP